MKKSLALFVLALAACSTTMTSGGDAESAIRAADPDFAGAMNRTDMTKVMTYYADDAVLLPPNAPAVHGKAAIQQFWSGMLSSAKFNVTLTPDTILTSGDLATEVGHYDLTVTPPGGGASIADKGKYSVTWRRGDDGKWRIAVDMFSSDAPPPSGR
jgi:uncharacterized protein (TIGR02246 family)